jgi:hypothetical protein
MKITVDKIKIVVALVAVALTVTLVSLALPRPPQGDAQTRTVVITTHHGTQRSFAKLPDTRPARVTQSGTTLSGDVDFGTEALG